MEYIWGTVMEPVGYRGGGWGYSWDTKIAELKVPSAENSDLSKDPSPFYDCSKSEYSIACFTYCQKFCLPLNCLSPPAFSFFLFYSFIFGSGD